ncbi:MAG: GerMN domain-containing protein [Dethiobacter sp.]
MFKNRKVALVCLCLATLLALVSLSATGCTRSVTVPSPGEEDPVENLPPTNEVEVFLFFVDPALIESGEFGEFGYVFPIARSIAVGEGEDIVIRTLEALVAGPRVEDGNYYATIPASAEMIAVTREGSTLTINFPQEVLTDSPGGTLWGSIFVQSIVFTATQFPEVEQVMVLVEGEFWDDGHSVWEKPLGQKDLKNF